MFKLLFHKRNRNFLRLWLAQLISQFGDRINQLALVGLMTARAPGSVTGLTKVIAFTILPVFVIQPIAGVLVDRWDRRTTLFVCDIARGILVLSIPFIFMQQEMNLPIYIVVFLAFGFSRFYIPAKMSIIPDLVESQHLLMANSLVSTTGMIAFVVGCVVGGYIIEWYGPKNGFIVDGATFFFSALLLFSMDLPSRLKINRFKISQAKEIVREVRKSFWIEMREGFEYLFKTRSIRFILLTLFILLSAAGSIYVVLIVFIQNTFHSVTKHLGVLAVFLGVGLFLGALAYGRWGKKAGATKTIFSCLLAGGLMLTAFTLLVQQYANIWIADVVALLLGLIVGPIFIASNTVAHMVSTDEMRGKVFSALEIVIHLAFLLAMLFSSWLSKQIDEMWILIGVGVIFSVIGIIGMFRLRFMDDLAFSDRKMA